MSRKWFILASLLLLTNIGCRACSNTGDYSPPVVGSNQAWQGPRAGSRWGQEVESDAEFIEPLPAVAQVSPVEP